jgi:hypothetical protein
VNLFVRVRMCSCVRMCACVCSPAPAPDEGGMQMGAMEEAPGVVTEDLGQLAFANPIHTQRGGRPGVCPQNV